MWRTLMREMVARAALPLAHVGVRESFELSSTNIPKDKRPLTYY